MRINLTKKSDRRRNRRQSEHLEKIALSQRTALQCGDKFAIRSQFLSKNIRKGGICSRQISPTRIEMEKHQKRPLVRSEGFKDPSKVFRERETEMIKGTLPKLCRGQSPGAMNLIQLINKIKMELSAFPDLGIDFFPGRSIGMDQAKLGDKGFPARASASTHHRTRNGRAGDAHFHRVLNEVQGTIREGKAGLGWVCGKGHRTVIKIQATACCNRIMRSRSFFNFPL